MLLAKFLISASILATDPGTEWAPAPLNGSELLGNYLYVSFGTKRNKLYMMSDRTVVISSENGIVTYASWTALQGRLCVELSTGSKECWPYTKQFVPGKTVELISGCGARSSWTLNQRTE